MKKTESISLWTPPGIVSYPYFSEPNTGGNFPDNKYKGDLFINKATFKEKGKDLQQAVLEVGKNAFGSSFKLKGNTKQHIPFKDTDTDDKITHELLKNCIMIRAKSLTPPIFIGPKLDANKKGIPLAESKVAAIKGGDWVLFNVSVFAYDQKGGGVSFGLNAVQYWKEGEPIGQGRAQALSTAQELETELEQAADDAFGSSKDSDEDDSDDII